MDAILELFTFDGRANRSWYFWHIVLDDFIIIALMLTLVMLTAGAGGGLWVPPMIGAIGGGIWAAIAVTVKRLHDLDRPGWHWWLMIVPFYNIYLGFVLLLARGTEGSNQYGADPLTSKYQAELLEG